MSSPPQNFVERRAKSLRHMLRVPSPVSPARSSSDVVWQFYILGTALYALIFNLWQIEPVPTQVHLVGVGIAALCFFPLALWVARGSQGLPIFPLICIAYLLAFGLPIYLTFNEIVIFSRPQFFAWEQTLQTVSVSGLGIGSMILGYYSIENRPLVSQLDLPFSEEGRRRYLLVAVFGGGLFLLLQATGVSVPGGGAATLTRILAGQIYVGIILLTYLIYEGKSDAGSRLLFYLALTVSVLYGFTSGMLEIIIIPFLLILVVRWQVTRKLPIWVLVAGFPIFIFLNAIKADYRNEAWNKATNLGLSQRIDVWVSVGQRAAVAVSEDPITGTEAMFRKAMQRFDLLHQFVRIQEMTPATIPFWGGETYSYFVYGLIPRFLWPDKPIASLATDNLAITYGFLDPNQVGTVSIGSGFLPEAYANFGVAGVVWIMFFQGMFLSMINTSLNGPWSDGGKAIYLAVMIQFLNAIGAQTAMQFIGAITGIAGSALIMRLFCTAWAVKAPIEYSDSYKAAARQIFLSQR